MASIRQLRDGFPWYMPQDIYNTERIEFSRGPGGLAFGDVDVGGIINITTKRANAKRQASAQVRYDNWGSQRYSLDVNQPLAESGVSVRLNAIRGENESWRQRSGTELRGLAGAVRWEPFKNRKTVIDFTYEHGDQDEGFSHVVLDDQTAAYVRGTGTTALDANPTLAGVQVNGVGMQQIRAATGVDHLFGLIDGKIYSLQSTPTATFRSSMVQIGAAVATGTDPVNPRRFPIIGVSESIVPRGQDWGGPINKLNSKFHAYTLEFRHAFTDRFSVLVAHNGQKDDTRRINVFNGNVAGVGIRDVLIDVNPNLPDPTDPTRTRLISNPRFEQYYAVHNPVTLIDGHDIKNFRGVAVYDAPLPWIDQAAPRLQRRLPPRELLQGCVHAVALARGDSAARLHRQRRVLHEQPLLLLPLPEGRKQRRRPRQRASAQRHDRFSFYARRRQPALRSEPLLRLAQRARLVFQRQGPLEHRSQPRSLAPGVPSVRSPPIRSPTSRRFVDLSGNRIANQRHRLCHRPSRAGSPTNG